MNIVTKWISLELIDVPLDARIHDPVCLKELATDMAAEGQLQEIIVTPVRGTRNADSGEDLTAHGEPRTAFEVLAGVGRYQAAKSLGWKEIRCSIRENMSEFDKVRITFAENADREDVDPFYQALLLQKMMYAKDLSQRKLAEMLGKAESYVSQYLALLKFSEEARKNFIRMKLSFNQLLQIVRLEGDEAQLKAAQEIAEGGLTVNQAKQAVQKHLTAQGKTPKPRRPAPSKDDPMAAIWAKLQEMNMNNAKWTVSYPEHAVWRFEIHPNGGDYAGFLTEWFQNMAQAIETNDPLMKESTAA